MNGTAISKLYVLLGLKSTLDEDGKKAQASMNKTALAVGAGMTAIGASAKLMADNINTSYLSFDTSIAQIKSLGGVTNEQMAEMRGSILGLSKEMPIAAESIAAGYYAMRSAGYGANQVMAEMPAIVRASVAGNMEVADTVNAVTMVLDIYGDKAGDATAITNSLLGTVQLFKTTMPELQGSLAKSADAANMLGIEFNELNAASGLLRKNFLSADEAGTAFKTFLLRLADNNTQEYLESLGVSVTDASGNFVGLQSVLDQLDVALQNAGGNVNQAAILNEAFGASAVRVAMSLISQKDSLGGFTRALKEGKAVDQAFEAQMESTGAKLEIARNKIDAAKIALGDSMAPATIAAADAMGWFAGALEGIPDPLQAMAGTGLMAAQSLIVIGPALAGVVPLINTYRASTFAATAATQGFTAALMANPAALAAVAIGAVALSLGTYYLAARRADSAAKDLNKTERSAIEIKRDRIREIQREIEAHRTRLKWLREMQAEEERGGALGKFASGLRQREIDDYTEKVADLTEEMGGLQDQIADLDQAEIRLDLEGSIHDVDTLESTLSTILRLMDEIEGTDLTQEELEDREAIQEIRVRVAQEDLDEAEKALKAWEKGGDNEYALEFGADAGRKEHQRLIDEVTKARVGLNGATRDYNDTLDDLASLEDENEQRQEEIIDLVVDLNIQYGDLALTLEDVAKGQDHVNQKVREYIALTPAGQERLRQLDLLYGREPETSAPTNDPSVTFYGKGYAPQQPDAGEFETTKGGGLRRKPGGEKAAPQVTVEPIDKEAYEAIYPPAPRLPTITIDPISSDVLLSEEELNEIRTIRNQLDSDATLTNKDLREIYEKIQEEIPEMGNVHDLTVDQMIQQLNQYIKRQEVAIANMQALGGTGGTMIVAPRDSGQPERSAATGMPYVPRDMNVRVHRGEAIVPAEQAPTRNVTITINNPAVRDDRDIDLLTNQIFRRLQRA